jgi:hypothetical protein
MAVNDAAKREALSSQQAAKSIRRGGKKRKKTPLVAMTASMIKGGGYIDACTRQPSTRRGDKSWLMLVQKRKP